MHSHTALFVHVTFATFDRAPSIVPEIRSRLHAFMGGIAKHLECKPIEIGGVADHVHLLIEVPPKVSISDLVAKMKSNSSRWIHETTHQPTFAWQRGYGAFSVSPRDIGEVRIYIRGQEEHHRVRTFREEYLEFPEKYAIEFDLEHCLK